MGVKDLSKFIRKSKKTHNSTLKSIFESNEIKNRVAIDASVISKTHLSTTPTAQSRLHCEPKIPIPSLPRVFVDYIAPFIEAGFLAFFVYDGIDSPFKAEEHSKRYGDRDAKRSRLLELYGSVDDSGLLPDEALNEVLNLRKSLISLSPHIFAEIEEVLMRTYPGKVFFIGSPYEADHQLAALYHQGIVDYICTVDSDLTVLGTDVITNVTKDGKCYIANYSEIVNSHFPKQFKTAQGDLNVPVWSDGIMREVACFLGNDFIPRCYGNGVKKVAKFVNAIADEDGQLKGEDVVWEAIRKVVVKGADPHYPRRYKKLSEEEREKHIARWKQTLHMFTYGPAFLIKCTNTDTTPRDVFPPKQDKEYKILLGPYRGDVDDDWEGIDFGFDPVLVFKEKLSNSMTYDDDTARNKIYDECFHMVRWSKGGVKVEQLPLPSQDGKQSHYGSILQYDIMPINCFGTEQLKFWLACRQVSFVHCKDREIPELVAKVLKVVGSDLPPIPLEMMRGAAGYVSPEALVPRNDGQEVHWLRGKDLLELLKMTRIELNSDDFSAFFGKRNSTRKRCLLHLKGGSYDLQHISATRSLMCKGISNEKSHIVFQASCAPSQKLKEKNKEKFYSCRLVAEVSRDNGKFIKFLNSPYRFCDCPNGCIWDSHSGALVLLLISMTKLASAGYTFEKMLDLYPEPINSLLQAPILVKFIWPLLNSTENRESRVG